MAQHPIILGQYPGDKKGDPARVAGAKVNQDFAELYAAIANLSGLNLVAGPVTALPAGSPPTASLGGTAPNYTLNLALPVGPAGAGAPTSADILAIAERDDLLRGLAAAGVPDQPSLILDFVSDVHFAKGSFVGASILSLVAALSGSSFARSSTATYLDSDGLMKTAATGVPRVDFDALTRQRRGLLLEPSRTNSAIRSEEIFGFGAGWGGFCKSAAFLCPTDLHTYTCARARNDMAAINLPFAAGATKRAPDSNELANGYGCGPADLELFNWLAWWSTGQVGRAIGKAGLTADDTDIDRLAKAIRSMGGNYRLAGGSANAFAITLDPAPTDWTDLINVPFFVRIASMNTTVPTLAVAGLPGSKPITTRGGWLGVPAGLMRPGAVAILIYNGTALEYINSPPETASNFTLNQSTGSDSNPGTLADPLRSIQECLRRTPPGGTCYIALVADYAHDETTGLLGRKVNMNGMHASGTGLVQRSVYMVADAKAPALQAADLTAKAEIPNSTSAFVLHSGSAWQSNSITFNRTPSTGTTTPWSCQFLSLGTSSMELISCSLNSSPSGMNTTWFGAVTGRFHLQLSNIGVFGDTSGKIYTAIYGGTPLAAGGDPNSLWNFDCNMTTS